MLTDTHQHCSIVCHDRHAHLDDSACQTFVAQLPRSAGHQRGDVTFDDRPAVPTDTGQVDLMRGAYTLQACGVEDVPDLLLARRRIDGRDSRRNPHGENPSPMKRVA